MNWELFLYAMAGFGCAAVVLSVPLIVAVYWFVNTYASRAWCLERERSLREAVAMVSARCDALKEDMEEVQQAGVRMETALKYVGDAMNHLSGKIDELVRNQSSMGHHGPSCSAPIPFKRDDDK